MKKERRKNIRFKLLNCTLTTYINNKSYFISDISNCGLFIETEDVFEPNKLIELKVELPGDLGFLDIQGRTKRVVWAVKKQSDLKKGIGIELIFNFNNKSTWTVLVNYQRNKQIVAVSRRIIDEFYGGKRNET